MFKSLTAVAGSLEALVLGLADAVAVLHEASTHSPADPDVTERLARLEQETAKQLASAEALMMKVQGKFDAARASEERTRRLIQADTRPDDGDEEGLDLEELGARLDEHGLSIQHADGGNGEGVQPMPPALDGRASPAGLAHELKWRNR